MHGHLADPDADLLRRLAERACLAALGDTMALAVAIAEPQPTGADRTFWVTDAAGPAGPIVTSLSRDGVAGALLADAGGLKLFELAGFYQASDPRLARAPGRL